MMYLVPVALVAVILAGSSSAASVREFSIDGHLTHGVNTFNSKPLVDFSNSSTIFQAAGPMHEVGVFDPSPGATNGSRITDATPLTARMATINAWDLQQQLGVPQGKGPFNIPLADAPTLSVQSRNVNDRIKPRPYADSTDGRVVGEVYRSGSALSDIRLSRWNFASSRITGRCEADGTATATIQIRNGLPNALYTMVDIGVTDALTDKEALSIGVFGGVPNVLTTDARGYGKATRKVNYCPLDKCEGSERCTLYVALFCHYDHVIYGGAPALDLVGPAIGSVGGNHVQMFFNADVLQRPKNKYCNCDEEEKSEL